MRQSSVRFENILDECIAAIQEQGQAIEDCLSRYPAQRAELAPLLQVVVRLQAARSLRASPEFRRASVTRMSNLMTARPRRADHTRALPNLLRSLRQGWPTLAQRWGAVAVVLVCLLIGGGVVSASNDTLPGDTLYPVKRAVEAVQLAVSLDETSNTRLHLGFATRRLDEAEALLNEGRPQEMERALADYAAQIDSVSTLVSSENGLTPDQWAALVDLLVTAQARQETQLAALLDRSPETVQRAIQQALTASRTARDRARELRPPVWAETPEPTQAPTPEPSPASTGTPQPSVTPTVPPSSEPVKYSTPSAEPTLPAGSTPTPEPTLPRWTNSTATPQITPLAPPRLTPTAWPTQPPPSPQPTPTRWPMPTRWPTPTRWPAPTRWPTQPPSLPQPTPIRWPTPPPVSPWPTRPHP